MKKQSFILFVLLSVVLSLTGGCGSKKQQTPVQQHATDEQTSEQKAKSLRAQYTANNLTTIEFSIYTARDSATDPLWYRGQPEGAILLIEQYEQIRTLRWLDSAKQQTVLTQQVRTIMLLDFTYENQGRVVARKYLAYVEDTKGGAYVKPFAEMKGLYVETYRQEDAEKVINRLGREDWFILAQTYSNAPEPEPPIRELSSEQKAQSLRARYAADDLDYVVLYTYVPYDPSNISNKTQPEHGEVLSTEHEKTSLLRWLDSAKQQTVLTQQVRNIFFLQFDSTQGGKVVARQYLAYVTDANGRFYVKPFKWVDELEIDEYHEEDAEKVINRLGREDWFIVKKAPL